GGDDDERVACEAEHVEPVEQLSDGRVVHRANSGVIEALDEADRLWILPIDARPEDIVGLLPSTNARAQALDGGQDRAPVLRVEDRDQAGRWNIRVVDLVGVEEEEPLPAALPADP